MNWFAQQRQDWIAETLAIFGFINRVHLVRKFGISGVQAGLDFNVFNARHPGAMTFDPRKRIYVSAASPNGLLEKI